MRRRTIKVHHDVASIHLNSRLYDHILLALHLFHNPLCPIDAIRDLLNGLPHAILCTADNLIRQIIQAIQVILIKYLAYLFCTDMICGYLGADISCDLIRGANVPPDHLHDSLVKNTTVVKFHQGNEETVLVNIVVIR